jgi:hypothetical protein
VKLAAYFRQVTRLRMREAIIQLPTYLQTVVFISLSTGSVVPLLERSRDLNYSF